MLLKNSFPLSNKIKNSGFSLTVLCSLIVKIPFKKDMALTFQGLLILTHEAKMVMRVASGTRLLGLTDSLCNLLIASPWEVI